ncbi:S-adenosylmethionine-dependent methyltransferase [Candidatus Hepatincola sp. Pdp]
MFYICKNLIQGVTKNITLYIPNNNELASLDSDFIKDWYAANAKQNFHLQKLTSIIIKAFNINDIFDNYIKSSPCILDIDVEGLDYEILKSLNINNYNVHAIIIELSSPIKGKEYTSEVINYLLQKGYILYSRTRVNHIFVKKTLLINK